MRLAILLAVALVLLSGLAAHADVIVKDTLDPANFANISYGGGIISQSAQNSSQVDGRTYVGYIPHHSAQLAELTINFVAFRDDTGDPVNEPARSSLFDMNIAAYQSLGEAQLSPRRVDAFFSQATQPTDLFEVPIGTTAPVDGFFTASVFQATYNLRPFGLSVTPGQNNFVGLSATGVPAGISFNIQRSSDFGSVVGGQLDYWIFSLLGSTPLPMFDLYNDSIQVSTRITITNFGDARDGDFNWDGVVDGYDFLEWQRNIGATSGSGLMADGNVDGVVDYADFEVWEQYFGQTVPSSVAANLLTVPEPSSLLLVSFAGLICCSRRPR